MAVVIDATVGGENANSYLTLAEADTYWESHYYSQVWDALSTDSKNRLMVMATRALDYWIMWNGSRVSEDQALRNPRYGLVDCDRYEIDSDIIHQDIKDATAELSGYMAGFNPSAEPDTKGFSKIKVDVIELEIDKMDRDSVTTIPDHVAKMLECFGSVKSRGAGMVVGLGRA